MNKAMISILAAIVVAAAIAAPVVASDKRNKSASGKCAVLLVSFEKKNKNCR
jgi:hypothetical protein